MQKNESSSDLTLSNLCPCNVKSCNCVILLGPTATGKTALGVKIALAFDGEIISADSRQVYRGLDIGSGKDLSEYTVGNTNVPYHLIDITNLKSEYNVFEYQKDFYKIFPNIIARKKLPIVVGGTGMYLDSIIRNYNMIEVPENKERHDELEKKSLEELNELLLKLRPNLHTLEDLRNKDRCIKAIQIAECMENFNSKKQNEDFFFVSKNSRPDIRPLVIGTTLERQELRERISKRLKERLDSGMIEEVSRLHKEGASWNRLEVLGLEYKFVAEFLQGKIASKNELFEKLNIAIRQFAKRQETWFRGMERKMQKVGMQIFWLSKVEDVNVRFKEAKELIEKHCSGHF